MRKNNSLGSALEVLLIVSEIMSPPGIFGMELTLDGQTRAGLRWIILKGIAIRLHEGQITSIVQV